MPTSSFVSALAGADIGATFNFYRNGLRARLRRERLERYLDERADAPVLLVAEAPGYRGTRVSGIPLTSERQLTGIGPAEATATIVHRVLADLGLARRCSSGTSCRRIRTATATTPRTARRRGVRSKRRSPFSRCWRRGVA